MPVERHALHQELPEFHDEIHELKVSDNHFARLFKEYDELDHEINRVEQGVENTSDEYLEQLKHKRLALKDEMFGMLKKHSESAKA